MTTLFNRIFDVFSRREAQPPGFTHDVPTTFRNRVLMWVSEVFSNERAGYYSAGDYRKEFWDEIHRFLRFRHGRFQLAKRGTQSTACDVIQFLRLECDGEEFLDFLEYIFRVECFGRVTLPDKQVVQELNELVREDDLPYYVTDFVKEEVRENGGPYGFGGVEIKTVAHPQVIVRSSDVTHVHAVEPALGLLRDAKFKSANSEFLEALEDFRKGDLGDCLTKCGSAFESVMQVLCAENGWPYSPTDTARPLVKTMMRELSLDAYWEPLLMIVATLRNRLSPSHGGGSAPRRVERPVVEYAITSTAAAILFLVQKASQV